MTLFKIVKELAACNDMGVKPLHKWPFIPTIAALERQANKLPKDLILNFVDGETEEIKQIVEDLDIKELNDFLNDVFNGDIEILV